MPMKGPYACKTVSELGLDGIQLSGGYHKTGFHISQGMIQKAYIELSKMYNISFPSIDIRELDYSNVFGPKDSRDTEIALYAIKSGIDAASYMNIPLVLVPNFEKSLVKSKEDFKKLIKILKDICDYAQDKNIIIASENTLSADENLLLLKKVKKPNLKIYFDTQNPYLHKGYNISEMIEKLFPYIVEVHVKDGKNKDLSGAIIGEGDSGFYKSIETLKRLNYSGWIILENYYDQEPLRLKNNNYFELITQDIEILKNYLI